MSGTIPDAIGNLQHLKYFAIFNSAISGTVPESLFNIPSLKQALLPGNRLGGTIPQSITKSTLYVEKRPICGLYLPDLD